mmetsp:Transcript_11391/g.17082  ORF Transcript_11391/g.17082 Transcript_11391/m.17082 type:complete len:457 (-) Transcript_11391:57-1427(-)
MMEPNTLREAWKKNKSIRFLDLSFNNITDDGAKYLMDMLDKNTTLKQLILMGNALSADMDVKLKEKVRSKRTATTSSSSSSSSSSGKSKTHSSSRSKSSRRKTSSRRRTSARDSSSSSTKATEVPVPSGDPDKLRERLTLLEAENQQLKMQLAAAKKSSSSSSSKPASGSEKRKQQLILTLKNIRITEKLAATGGSSAAVYACYVDGWQCAIKEFVKEGFGADQQLVSNFMSEIALYEKLPPHNNIVRYLHSEETPTKIRLYLTRYSSSLGSEIRQLDTAVSAGLADPFSARKITAFALDLIRGLEFLHSHNIIHRDLKSDNVFVLKNERKEIQTLAIGDFDTAKVLNKNVVAKTVVGTPSFMAPEVLAGEGAYDFKADVYSFGMILYECITLKLPYHDVPLISVASKIMSGERPKMPKMDSEYDRLIQLFQACTERDSKRRPTPAQIKEALFELL